jgi:hypothetical protein
VILFKGAVNNIIRDRNFIEIAYIDVAEIKYASNLTLKCLEYEDIKVLNTITATFILDLTPSWLYLIIFLFFITVGSFTI